MQFNRLVLPAPFGPMIALSAPSATEKLTSDRAVTPPKRNTRAATSRRGEDIRPKTTILWCGAKLTEGDLVPHAGLRGAEWRRFSFGGSRRGVWFRSRFGPGMPCAAVLLHLGRRRRRPRHSGQARRSHPRDRLRLLPESLLRG